MNLRQLGMHLAFPLCALTAFATAAGYGCSASKDESNSFGQGGTSSGDNHGGTGAAPTGPGSGGEGGVILDVDGGNPDGFSNDSACVASQAEAVPIPLDMMIILDKSGSMSGALWTGATNALKAFINDPASNDISVGLEYFPVVAAADDECDYLNYKDLDVPVDILPMNGAPLVNSINATSPSGGTPMYPALKGVLYAATERQDAFPDHRVIVVLATDGEPTSCPPTDVTSIAALAQSALNYNGVLTFTIAMSGSDLVALNQVAAAGGTMQAYDVSQNIQAFSQKMAEIRAASLGCEFIIPEPPRNEELDPDKVNVNYTAGGEGMPQTFPHAENLADCAGEPGWYYDNNVEPTKIFLCPVSCDTVKADLKADIQVAFGCKTEIN